MRKILFIVSFVFTVLFSYSQQTYTLSGIVTEKSSGEKLVGVSVYDNASKKGISTNSKGFYSLQLPTGTYNITYSFIGLKTVTEKIKLNKNKKFNITLLPSTITTDEVIIRGESTKNIESSKVSQISIEAEQIKKLPAIMGEIDILKTIQLLPGVSSGGEGNTGFYVRGGGPDQNLILLDDAVVYNASHLLGFFSVFNADAVKGINLIKGGMPAEYGGRLSSVLDISLKEGNKNKFGGEGGIGIISSRLTLEGPLVKNKSSIIISGRRTYIDILTQPFLPEDLKGNGYHFYDLSGKINYKLSNKDKLSLSFYNGKDKAHFGEDDGFKLNVPWGNTISSLRWNHLFNEKLFMKNSIIYSKYDFNVGIEMAGFEFKLKSVVEDFSIKNDFTYLPNIKHNIKFGTNTTYHVFRPASVSGSSGDVDFSPEEIFKQYANESALYISDDYEVTDMLKINLGGRFTTFQQLDKGYYMYDGKHTQYQNFEPRFSARLKLNTTSSFKTSYSENYQYVHLASMGGMSLPTDLWLPSSDIIKPKHAVQYTTGYFKNFENNMFETSVEVYYKEMTNLVEYKEGSVPEDNANGSQDELLTQGDGNSYGVELFLKKVFGNTTGWIGYTHSYSNRIFDNVNNGEWYPAKYDRRHDLSIVLTHNLNKKLNISAVFVYASGSRLTVASERYILDGNIYTEFTSKNGYKMDDYHRMDISLNYTPHPNRKFKSTWNFSVYNLYNRHNPYYVYLDFETEDGASLETGGLTPKAMQTSLFPIIPTITWNFNF